jgi:hypothetical protein
VNLLLLLLCLPRSLGGIVQLRIGNNAEVEASPSEAIGPVSLAPGVYSPTVSGTHLLKLILQGCTLCGLQRSSVCDHELARRGLHNGRRDVGWMLFAIPKFRLVESTRELGHFSSTDGCWRLFVKRQLCHRETY